MDDRNPSYLGRLFWAAFIVLAAFFITSSAKAAMSEQTRDDIVSLVAGYRVDAQCERDAAVWDAEIRPWTGGEGYILGYVMSDRLSVIRLSPRVCSLLDQPVTSSHFGEGLNILAHEASHSRGIMNEAEAACWGLLWAADLARRFYGVEFFTPASEAILTGSRRMHDALYPEYRTMCR